MKKIIVRLLERILGDLDSGNSNLTEEESMKVIQAINDIYTTQQTKLNIKEACDYLHMSNSSFRNKVREGLIPKGIKEPHNPLYWKRIDLDKYIIKYGNKKES